MEKKGPFTIEEIKAFSNGKQIWGKYLVLELLQRKTRDGKDFHTFKIGDKSGEVDVIAWENCQWSGEVEAGIVIGLLGDISIYNNRLQITAKRIKGLDEDNLEYQKSPAISLELLTAEFEQTLQDVKDPYLRKLLPYIFTPERKKLFFKSPAAKKIHHNYAGGLLEHTMNIVRLCRQCAANYHQLNLDLLLTGALLHDVGKTRELSMRVTPEYTSYGRLMGHIVMGADILAEGIRAYRQEQGFFPEDLELILKHMILSHHGTLEYGSPVKPLTPEAFMIYSMDNLDAKLFVYFTHIEEDKENPDPFTPYDSLYQQNYYKPRYRYQESPAEERPEKEE